MPSHDSLSRYYATLTAVERFTLTVEAMARKDSAEADRLEDTCPRFLYRREDAEFRDRMSRAYAITAMACLNMREGLAQLRMARLFREHCHGFAEGPAEVAFLYGRAYGKWEAGATYDVNVPEREVLTAELDENPDLRRQLDEVRQCAVIGAERLANALLHATGELYAADFLAQWEGFGRFCRQLVGVEVATLMAAFGLGEHDVGQKLRNANPGSEACGANVAERADRRAQVWDSRFDRPGGWG